MKFTSSACTNRGLVREKNEDAMIAITSGSTDSTDSTNSTDSTGNNIWFLETVHMHDTITFSERALFSVCDGLGGEDAGELASAFVCSQLGTLFDLLTTKHSQTASFEQIAAPFFSDINRRLIAETAKSGFKRSGTTAAGIWLQENDFYTFNIGDSRIYHYTASDNAFKQLTRDHTEAQLLVEIGILKTSDARRHPASRFLTRFIGDNQDGLECQVDYLGPLPMHIGDYLILMTDGVYEMCDEALIHSAFTSSASVSQIASLIKGEILTNGANDNFTFILLKKEA